MAPRVTPIFPKFMVRSRYDNLSKISKISFTKQSHHVHKQIYPDSYP